MCLQNTIDFSFEKKVVDPDSRLQAKEDLLEPNKLGVEVLPAQETLGSDGKTTD